MRRSMFVMLMIVALTTSLFVTGCGQSTEDQITKLREKITELESQVKPLKELENRVDSLENRVDSLETKKLKQAVVPEISTKFHVTIDYDRLIEEYEPFGKPTGYYYTEKRLSSEKERVQGIVKVEAISLPFSELRKSEKITSMTSEEVIAALDKKGLRPATPKELVALCDECGDQDTLPRHLIALGVAPGGSFVVLDGSRCVPHADRRSLNLIGVNNGWDSYYHFLAFHR